MLVQGTEAIRMMKAAEQIECDKSYALGYRDGLQAGIRKGRADLHTEYLVKIKDLESKISRLLQTEAMNDAV